MFYSEIYVADGMDDFRNNYALPSIYLVMVDKDTGR